MTKVFALAVATLCVGVTAAPAIAEPAFRLHSMGTNTAAPGDSFVYKLEVENIGDAPSSGPMSLTVSVSAGMTMFAFGGTLGFECAGFGVSTTTCTRSDTEPSVPAGAGVGSFMRGTTSTQPLPFLVQTAPDAPLGPATIRVELSGGGGAPVLLDDRLTIGPPAGFGIADVGGMFSRASGESERQAGAHPDEMVTTFRFNTSQPGPLETMPDELVRSVITDLPPGVIGDPTAVPVECPRDLFHVGLSLTDPPCPPASQVGVATATDNNLLGASGASFGVFKVSPSPGLPAQFAFRIQGVPAFLNPGVRTGGDYGLTVTSPSISQIAAISKVTVRLWGVPADAKHDPQRGKCLTTLAVDSCPAGVPMKPFLTMPTACTGPLTTLLQATSWDRPDVVKGASFDHDLTGAPIAMEGCENLAFDPSLTVQPSNVKPDNPAGYEVTLRIPQDSNLDSRATAHLKRAVVTLPEGVAVNPSSAHGLKACAPGEIALASAALPTCPQESKIGTLEVDTPLLDQPLDGEVYVAQQGANPFGTLLAIYIVARGPGVVVKLPGRVDANPETGQLTAIFDNTPQLPFSEMRVRFKGGPTAPLVNPPTCGHKTVTAELTPWSGTAPVVSTTSFTIPCPAPFGFAPVVTAGSRSPVGGTFSPFALRIDRADGTQAVAGVDLTMPPGFSARLKDVPQCSDAQAAAGACPPETRVGTATVGAGAGPSPFFLQGPVSLTGPYKGAPFGLVVAVRAIAGPYDLGTVVVRQALRVDPVDAHVTVVSDPLPTILQGIPLRVRTINVDVDRSRFMLNPTSCATKRIDALLTSQLGALHAATQRVQLSDCRALSLQPRLALRFVGKKQTREGGHPGLRAVLTQKDGQANLKAVAVRLPLSVALDPDNAGALCEYADGLRGVCPEASIIGRAKAITPILNRPLEGPVYFVKGVRFGKGGRPIRTLPTLFVPLRGEVAIDLRASTSVVRNQLVSTFQTIPDAPVSRFELSIDGGRRGILVATRKVCGRQVAQVDVDGHNGRRSDRPVAIATPCKHAKKR